MHVSPRVVMEKIIEFGCTMCVYNQPVVLECPDLMLRPVGLERGLVGLNDMATLPNGTAPEMFG